MLAIEFAVVVPLLYIVRHLKFPLGLTVLVPEIADRERVHRIMHDNSAAARCI